MDDNKTAIFQDFARKAKEKIEEKKKKKTKQLYVRDSDVTITIRGISDEEFLEITEMKDMTEIERDQYMAYYACPELQEASAELVKDGTLTEKTRYKIAEMFSAVDRAAIVRDITRLSGLSGEPSVVDAKEHISELKEVKN